MEESYDGVLYLRLRGLPWSATKADIVIFLTDVCICEGEHSILFIINEEGKKTGDALVSVPTQEDFDKAISCNRNYIGKRYIEVVGSTEAEFNNSKERSLMSENECVVRLRGLPYSTTEQDLRDFFSEIEIVDDGIAILQDNSNRCTGEAYVEFCTKEGVESATLKHRQKIGPRFIEVYRSSKLEKNFMSTNRPTPLMSINTKRGRVSSPRDERTFGPSAYHRQRSPSPLIKHHGRGRHYEDDCMYDQTNFPVEESYVHMRGLPFECTERDVEDFFYPLYPICIGFCYGRDKKFTGECDVFFESEADVHRAMNRDKKKIGRRYAELFMRIRKNFYPRKPTEPMRENYIQPSSQRMPSYREEHEPRLIKYASYNSPSIASHKRMNSYAADYEYSSSQDNKKPKVVSYPESGSNFYDSRMRSGYANPPVHEYYQNQAQLNSMQMDNSHNVPQSSNIPPSSPEAYPFY